MRQSETQHILRPRIKESFFRFRHRGAGGDDIVYENYIGADDFLRIDGFEAPFQILQSFLSVFYGSLAWRVLYFFKDIIEQSEIFPAVNSRQLFHDQLALVVTPIFQALFGGGNRD